ncbi:hypothetical protein [Rickettsia akari]
MTTREMQDHLEELYSTKRYLLS